MCLCICGRYSYLGCSISIDCVFFDFSLVTYLYAPRPYQSISISHECLPVLVCRIRRPVALELKRSGNTNILQTRVISALDCPSAVVCSLPCMCRSYSAMSHCMIIRIHSCYVPLRSFVLGCSLPFWRCIFVVLALWSPFVPRQIEEHWNVVSLFFFESAVF